MQKRTDKKIRTLAIDKNYYDNIDIVCDNLKVLAGIDFGRFDIVDLDAMVFLLLRCITFQKISRYSICYFHSKLLRKLTNCYIDAIRIYT